MLTGVVITRPCVRMHYQPSLCSIKDPDTQTGLTDFISSVYPIFEDNCPPQIKQECRSVHIHFIEHTQNRNSIDQMSYNHCTNNGDIIMF